MAIDSPRTLFAPRAFAILAFFKPFNFNFLCSPKCSFLKRNFYVMPYAASLFSPFCPSGRRTERAEKGSSIRHDIEISFEEAAFGATKEIEIERFEKCQDCKGSGSKEGSGRINCHVCKGSGMEQHTKRTPFGYFATQTTCRKCQGRGLVVENPCKKCDGKGVAKMRRKIEFKIPEGIAAGSNLRLKGEGNAGL